MYSGQSIVLYNLLEIEAALMKPDLSRNTSRHPTDGGARLVSLDAFRGLIIAGMILVTDPGTYSAVYPQLLHAQWDGATATDMIFPSFLVIIGGAMTFSFASRIERGEDRLQLLRHVFIRSGVL